MCEIWDSFIKIWYFVSNCSMFKSKKSCACNVTYLDIPWSAIINLCVLLRWFWSLRVHVRGGDSTFWKFAPIVHHSVAEEVFYTHMIVIIATHGTARSIASGGGGANGKSAPLTAKTCQKKGENWEKRGKIEKAKTAKVLSFFPSWQIGLATLLRTPHFISTYRISVKYRFSFPILRFLP